MASEEVPPPNLGEEITDTEPEREEDAEEAAEEYEGQEGQQKEPRGSWAGSYITQADIDRLRRSRRIPEGWSQGYLRK